MESTGDQVRSFALSVLMHGFLVLLVWFGIDWIFPPHDVQAAGEPLQATLKVSQADLQKARAAIDKAAKAEKLAAAKPKPLPPQPKPEPRPQDSPTPPQLKPQEQLARPDTEVQPAVSRLATKPPPPEPVDKEPERKQKQEQAELTEDIAKQQEAERRQRLRQQMLDIQKQRQDAERRTKLEEQRMQQLADLAGAKPKPVEAAPAKPGTGARGPDEGLLARYKAAMLQTADYNWNHTGAPELTVCKVRFTQIPGGEVINVEFINCPYDAEGREFVERALKKTPMPYAGFETVFLRQAELSFCYPREKCQ